jgi:hypothetical protein
VSAGLFLTRFRVQPAHVVDRDHSQCNQHYGHHMQTLFPWWNLAPGPLRRAYFALAGPRQSGVEGGEALPGLLGIVTGAGFETVLNAPVALTARTR